MEDDAKNKNKTRHSTPKLNASERGAPPYQKMVEEQGPKLDTVLPDDVLSQ